MLKRIKQLLQVNSLLISISVTILIAFLSLIKMPDVGVEIDQIDKLYHSIAYFVLTFFWLIYANSKNKLTLVLSLCIIYGIIIEIAQMLLTNYRSGDFIDVLANTLGVFLAYYVFIKIK